MKQMKYTFIYKAKGHNPEKHHIEFESESFKTMVFGVDSFETALAIAEKSVENGVELIELCGGFNRDYADELYNHFGGKVKVGVVDYFPDLNTEK